MSPGPWWATGLRRGRVGASSATRKSTPWLPRSTASGARGGDAAGDEQSAQRETELPVRPSCFFQTKPYLRATQGNAARWGVAYPRRSARSPRSLPLLRAWGDPPPGHGVEQGALEGVRNDHPQDRDSEDLTRRPLARPGPACEPIG
eukprot:11381654-Alexandrium_andersonii.AAC.1